MKKIIMIIFYIFGNQLKEIFAFNYKIIIINLFFKIFSLYNEFKYIYVYCIMLNKGHACSNGNLADPQTFWFGVRLSSTQKKGIFEASEYLYRIGLCTTLYFGVLIHI